MLVGDGSLRGFFGVLKKAMKGRDYDIVHAHYPHVAIPFLLARLVRGRRPEPSVFTVHNSYHNFKLRNRLMLALVFPCFKRVVCCGRASFDSFPRLFRWLAGKRFEYVRNGIDIDRIDRIVNRQEEEPAPSSGAFEVACVARLVPIKNHFIALRAFHDSLRDDEEHASYLRFIGDGALGAPIQAEAEALRVSDRVFLDGLLPRDRVFRRLRQASLFVSASRGEGLPVAVLEAMACGCPVVLSNIAPHREIADGTDFIPLIEPDDVSGFTAAIREFRGMGDERRREVGRKCRRLVEERFGLEGMLRGYERIYSDLYAARPRVARAVGRPLSTSEE